MSDLLIFYLIAAIIGLAIVLISLPGIIEKRKRKKK